MSARAQRTLLDLTQDGLIIGQNSASVNES